MQIKKIKGQIYTTLKADNVDVAIFMRDKKKVFVKVMSMIP